MRVPSPCIRMAPMRGALEAGVRLCRQALSVHRTDHGDPGGFARPNVHYAATDGNSVAGDANAGLARQHGYPRQREILQLLAEGYLRRGKLVRRRLSPPARSNFTSINWLCMAFTAAPNSFISAIKPGNRGNLISRPHGRNLPILATSSGIPIQDPVIFLGCRINLPV